MKNVPDKFGNTPVHYISPETPVLALNALKDIKITEKSAVCIRTYSCVQRCVGMI